MRRIFKTVFVLLAFTTVLFGQSNDEVQVEKIERVKKYYIIYAKSVKQDIKYMIVSKKSCKVKGNRITKDGKYLFELNRVKGIGQSEVNCFDFDSKTEICEDEGYVMVYTRNLSGLCIISN